MADLSALTLKNTAGNTKSIYSILDDHADAIEAINAELAAAVPEVLQHDEELAYEAGDMVLYQGDLYVANSAIPAETPFVEGVDVEEWTKVSEVDTSITVLPLHNQALPWLEGQLAFYQGDLYRANFDIAAATPFEEGTGADQWTAVAKKEKVAWLVPVALQVLEVTPVHNTSYFVDGTASGAILTLPLSSENEGMKVYFKLQVATTFDSEIALTGADTLDGVAAGVSLTAAGDFIDLIATAANGWVSKSKLITP